MCGGAEQVVYSFRAFFAALSYADETKTKTVKLWLLKPKTMSCKILKLSVELRELCINCQWVHHSTSYTLICCSVNVNVQICKISNKVTILG